MLYLLNLSLESLQTGGRVRVEEQALKATDIMYQRVSLLWILPLATSQSNKH